MIIRFKYCNKIIKELKLLPDMPLPQKGDTVCIKEIKYKVLHNEWYLETKWRYVYVIVAKINPATPLW